MFILVSYMLGDFLVRGFPLLREISEYLCIEGFDETGGKEGKGNYDQQGYKGGKDQPLCQALSFFCRCVGKLHSHIPVWVCDRALILKTVIGLHCQMSEIGVSTS